MRRPVPAWLRCFAALSVLSILALVTSLEAACCYFSAKEKDIQQPGQKAYITWDPAQKLESFTVQPKFEGNAADFGMVIPTPSQPKIDEMPRDFFRALAVFTILKNREHPQSQLLWQGGGGLGGGGLGGLGGGLGGMGAFAPAQPRRPQVRILESGTVGALDYKIIAAERADDLFQWLKDHKYHYAGDEATLDHYLRKKWVFTVMKIDTMQLKRNADGTFSGELSPVRFQFTTEKLVYPLKITAISVKDKTEALFYIQAPYKLDLPGDMTYQYQWVPLLQNAQGWYAKGTFGRNTLPGRGDEWLNGIRARTPELLRRADQLGFTFVSGMRPQPGKDGRIPTTLEWARKLTAEDVKVLAGQAAYTDKVPNVDAGYSAHDVNDLNAGPFVRRIIQHRLDQSKRDRPGGYLVREAPAYEVKGLRILAGHLQEGQFVTKLRKTFLKSEMNDDLLIVPAAIDRIADRSEYEEILPSSPP